MLANVQVDLDELSKLTEEKPKEGEEAVGDVKSKEKEEEKKPSYLENALSALQQSLLFARDNFDSLELLGTSTYFHFIMYMMYMYISFFSVLGAVLMSMENIADALVTLRRWAVLDSTNPNASYKLANALNQDGNYDQALNYYSKATSLLFNYVSDPTAEIPSPPPTATMEEKEVFVAEQLKSFELQYKILHNSAATHLRMGDEEGFERYAELSERLLERSDDPFFFFDLLFLSSQVLPSRFPPLRNKFESGGLEATGPAVYEKGTIPSDSADQDEGEIVVKETGTLLALHYCLFGALSDFLHGVFTWCYFN